MELNYAGSAVREVPAHRILGNLESKELYPLVKVVLYLEESLFKACVGPPVTRSTVTKVVEC